MSTLEAAPRAEPAKPPETAAEFAVVFSAEITEMRRILQVSVWGWDGGEGVFGVYGVVVVVLVGWWWWLPACVGAAAAAVTTV